MPGHFRVEIEAARLLGLVLLLALTWRELKAVLHFDLIDSAITADDFCMIFSKMADDERFETLPDDYFDAETASEDESVAA